jgi:hypothetical protein
MGPRSYIKNSPLGEALLNITFQNVTNQSYQSTLEGNFTPGLWIAKADGTSYGGTNYSYSKNPQWAIKIYSTTSQECTVASECGGVPGDGSLESQYPGLAIGAIFTLNISGVNLFTDLISGLLLNQSGNFTGWGDSATKYLPSLGLSSEVMSALANPELFNSGAYGAPGYQNPGSSPSPWQVVGAAIWNAVSGVAAAISTAWSYIAAAGALVGYLVSELVTWGLAKFDQTFTVLRGIASAIVSAVEQLESIVEGLIVAQFSGIISSIRSEGASVGHALGLAYNSSVQNGSLAPKTLELWTLALVKVGLLATVFAAAFFVVISLILPVGSLVGSITGFIVAIVAAGLGLALTPHLEGAPSSHSTVWSTLVGEANQSSQSTANAANPSCAPDPNIEGPLFAFLTALIVPTLALGIAVYAVGAGPLGYMAASAIVGFMSLILAFVIATAPLPLGQLHILDGVAVTLTFVSWIVDFIATLIGVASKSIMLAPGLVIAGMDGAAIGTVAAEIGAQKC